MPKRVVFGGWAFIALLFALGLILIGNSKSQASTSLGWSIDVLAFSFSWAVVVYWGEGRTGSRLSKHPGAYRLLLLGGVMLSGIALVWAYDVPSDNRWWAMPILVLMLVTAASYWLEPPASNSPNSYSKHFPAL